MAAPPVDTAIVAAISKEIVKIAKIVDGKAVTEDVEQMRIAKIYANKGDTIRWVIENDHVLSVWFPDSGLFYTPVIAVQNKGMAEATIRSDAVGGLYEYAIYDHDAQEFVTCESHPKIEVPLP